ncbi:hypothetical protein BgiBS90_028878, partial [Biomphalaria glabrata]
TEQCGACLERSAEMNVNWPCGHVTYCLLCRPRMICCSRCDEVINASQTLFDLLHQETLTPHDISLH